MSDSFYSAPESEVELDEVREEGEFYVVSTLKFTVLYISTLGIYALYWFYRNWTVHKIKQGLDIWPIPRAIFAIFYIHSLFNNVNNKLKDSGSDFSWKSDVMATLFIVLSIASSVCDRLADSEIGLPYITFVSLIILPFTFYILLKAQKAINTAENDPAGSTNSSITALNCLWIFLGLLIWVAAIVGVLVISGVIVI
ncbi:hypothetical protein A9Q81_10250 [Gammaproteobacteria bacterium 42_54_T18]|nr:hypothetical protein A9Q81_10250 [Gammaproteobacteria bacterium 42_54_T18]